MQLYYTYVVVYIAPLLIHACLCRHVYTHQTGQGLFLVWVSTYVLDRCRSGPLHRRHISHEVPPRITKTFIVRIPDTSRKPMNKYYHRQTIPERLVTAEGIISIVQADPELAEALKTVGYEEEQFSEATMLVEQASTREVEQEVQLGAQVAATERVNELMQVLNRHFVNDRQLVRTALAENRELYVELRLHLRLQVNREARIRQMVHFYTEVVQHPTVLAALAEQHIAADRFIVRQGDIASLVEGLNIRQHLQGKAVVATQKRKAAMDKLDAWMKVFIRRARVALDGDEEQIRKLGVGVRVKK